MIKDYVKETIARGRQYITWEVALLGACNMDSLNIEFTDKDCYYLTQLVEGDNEKKVKAISRGEFFPKSQLLENDSLKRCITNESCYLHNISKRNDIENMRLENITKFIDDYNKIIDFLEDNYNIKA